MAKYIILVCFLFSAGNYKLLNTIPVNSSRVLTDHLGNIYTISKTNITKLDKEGNKLAEYSNANLGELSYADVSDPFRILLFFRDFNQIQLLDKYLAEIASPVSLDDLDINQVEIACTSNLGGFWVYDSQTTELKYIDRTLEIAAKSIPLNTVADITAQPDFLIEKNDLLFLNIPENGIFLFDKYGLFYKRIPLLNLVSFQIKENDIVFFENNSLFRYNHELMQTESILLPDTMGVVNARIEDNILYIQKPKEIKIYSAEQKD